MNPTPTENERRAFTTIIAVRDMKMARLRADWPGCNPSEWVTIHELSATHKVHRGAIRALIKKGYLEERPSGGWGPEVRVKPPDKETT